MSTLAQNFDLTNGFNILRILCGLFLLPHLFAKATNFQFMLGIYKSGSWSRQRLVGGSLTTEIICAPLLILIYTRYAAILCAIFLLVATWAAWRHARSSELWNIGGCEIIPLFWAIACIVVAMKEVGDRLSNPSPRGGSERSEPGKLPHPDLRSQMLARSTLPFRGGIN